MTVDVSEKNLEATIEAMLLAGGPDAHPGGAGAVAEFPETFDFAPGGYRKRKPEDYDRELCLDPGPVLDFIYATQPKEWEKFKKQHGSDAKDRLLKRLSSEIHKRGTLDVFRKGVKSDGCKFQLAYFKPSSGLNEALQTLYQANLFTVARQLKYSQKSEHSLDLVLFLNGIPIFTAELKNPLTGQNVEDAIRQYKFTRDPKEPLADRRKHKELEGCVKRREPRRSRKG